MNSKDIQEFEDLVNKVAVSEGKPKVNLMQYKDDFAKMDQEVAKFFGVSPGEIYYAPYDRTNMLDPYERMWWHKYDEPCPYSVILGNFICSCSNFGEYQDVPSMDKVRFVVGNVELYTNKYHLVVSMPNLEHVYGNLWVDGNWDLNGGTAEFKNLREVDGDLHCGAATNTYADELKKAGSVFLNKSAVISCENLEFIVNTLYCSGYGSLLDKKYAVDGSTHFLCAQLKTIGDVVKVQDNYILDLNDTVEVGGIDCKEGGIKAKGVKLSTGDVTLINSEADLSAMTEVRGDVFCKGLEQKNLSNLQIIDGKASFKGTSTTDVSALTNVHGDLTCDGDINIGVNLKEVDGIASFSNFKSLDLSNLTHAETLMLDIIGTNIKPKVNKNFIGTIVVTPRGDERGKRITFITVEEYNKYNPNSVLGKLGRSVVKKVSTLGKDKPKS